MPGDEPKSETDLLRAQLTAMLRTEARLYQTQAVRDRQLALFEKLYALGIALIAAPTIAKVGQLAGEFATRHLRYDAAMLLEVRDDTCTLIAFDGLTQQQAAGIKQIELAPSHPLVAHTDPLEYAGAGGDGLHEFAEVVGLATFVAYTLSGAGGPIGLFIAGSLPGAQLDDVSRRGLANLSTLCAATLGATAARLELERDRELLAQRVEERTRDLSIALETVTRLSRTDSLTSLANRRALIEHAEQALVLARRHERSLAIISIDVDHFKAVNDTFGHQVGDGVLVEVSRALVASVRESDRVGRIGGEEFLILLHEPTRASLVEVGERCRRALHDVVWSAVEPRLTRVTASFGIALFPDHADELQDLLRCADEALYQAKRRGRDAVVMYEPRAAIVE